VFLKQSGSAGGHLLWCLLWPGPNLPLTLRPFGTWGGSPGPEHERGANDIQSENEAWSCTDRQDLERHYGQDRLDDMLISGDYLAWMSQ